MRKQGLQGDEFVSTPSRRLLNHLLEGGKILGTRDEGREDHILWDICRGFHPNRRGMFTCWEQKVNARPGNCGARIDYVLCSLDMKGWFCDSNIQEGLMGSDHCPVYAAMKEKILIDGKEHHVKDLMNPPGMFSDGERVREYSITVDSQQLSGRLLPEFSGRRNIRDMFTLGSSMSKAQGFGDAKIEPQSDSKPAKDATPFMQQAPVTRQPLQSPLKAKDAQDVTHRISPTRKRSATQAATSKSMKRAKSTAPLPSGSASSKGQQSLKTFLKPKDVPASTYNVNLEESEWTKSTDVPVLASTAAIETPDEEQSYPLPPNSSDRPNSENSAPGIPLRPDCAGEKTSSVNDPFVTRESWSKLFTKPAAPRCESHDEPCISMLTKKQGINLGRSFWMCPRPLGPSGVKERNSQWRCGTFIWCSDWNTKAA